MCLDRFGTGSIRKGMTDQPFLVIAAFVIVTTVLAVTSQLMGDTLFFMKGILLDIQADRIVEAGMVLKSLYPGGEMSISMSGYSIRYNEEERGFEVKYGDQTDLESAKPLLDTYDRIDSPSSFRKVEDSLVLRKQVKDGDEVLVVDPGGSGSEGG